MSMFFFTLTTELELNLCFKIIYTISLDFEEKKKALIKR
jgi:hypothetical protein